MWPIAERRAKTDFTVRTANSKGRRAVLFLFRPTNTAELPTRGDLRRDLRRDLPVHPASDDSEALPEGKYL